MNPLFGMKQHEPVYFAVNGHRYVMEAFFEDEYCRDFDEQAEPNVFSLKDVETGNVAVFSGRSAVKQAIQYPQELISRVKESDFYKILLPSAVDYYETEKYIFCHAWIPLVEEVDDDMIEYFRYHPDWRDADESEWHKARWRNGMEMCCMHGVKEAGKTIVCGHWNCSWGHAHVDGICSERGKDAITTPFFAEGIIAIDACTARWGRVNCIRIEE